MAVSGSAAPTLAPTLVPFATLLPPSQLPLPSLRLASTQRQDAVGGGSAAERQTGQGVAAPAPAPPWEPVHGGSGASAAAHQLPAVLPAGPAALGAALQALPGVTTGAAPPGWPAGWPPAWRSSVSLSSPMSSAPVAAAGPSTSAQGGELYLSDMLKGNWAWLLCMIALSVSQTASTEI